MRGDPASLCAETWTPAGLGVPSFRRTWVCERTQELNSRDSCGGGWGLAGWKVTHTGTCWMLHPPGHPTRDRGDPRREQARVSQQGERGAGQSEGVSRSFLSSLTSRRTPSEQTGCSPCGRICSVAFSWNQLGAPERRGTAEAGRTARRPRSAPARGSHGDGAASPRRHPARPEILIPGSICATPSPSPQDLFFVVCNVESVYDLIRTLGIQR